MNLIIISGVRTILSQHQPQKKHVLHDSQTSLISLGFGLCILPAGDEMMVPAIVHTNVDAQYFTKSI